MEMSKEVLNGKTADELRKMCKDNGISYCSHTKKLTKSEMIDKLLQNVTVSDTENEVSPVVENVSNDVTTDTHAVNRAINGGYGELPDPETFLHTKNKEQYIENAEVGTLIAFLDENGKPRTAAVENRSSKRRVLKVKTEYGWEFIVPYEKVLWVKLGDKWPSGIYRLLKGWKYAHRGNADKQ